MFKHFSPRLGLKQKQTQTVKNKPISFNSLSSSPALAYSTLKKDLVDKQPHRKQKPIKNMQSLNNDQPMLSIPASSVSSNKSVEEHKNPTLVKNASTLQEYYDKFPNLLVSKPSKEEISLSEGSCHSDNNFNSLKKVNSPKSTVADKFQAKPKKISNTPTNNHLDPKIWLKSAKDNHQVNRSKYENVKSDKRILSFGGRKHPTGGYPQDGDICSKKSGNSSTGNNLAVSPDTPQIKLCGPQPNQHEEAKDLGNQHTSNEQIGKTKVGFKHLPRFIANAHIRSTPYLMQYKIDCQTQATEDFNTDNHSKLQLLQQLQKQLKLKKDYEDEKFVSFNRQEMFLNLKKRQERHSQISKQLKKMNLHVELKIVNAEGQKSITLTFIKKIVQCKRTSIYLVYHQKTRSLYCLKRSHLTHNRQDELDNVIRQHKIQQFCSHPQIVKAFGTLYDSSHIYLFMEFMEGETLGTQLKNQVLKNMSEQAPKSNEDNDTKVSNINRIRKIIFEIATAVAYLHERGIIHHDIKPDNIFISHNIYKLGDFGSAVLHGSLEYVGTLDYAAPQILTRAAYDQKVDIWSLGCIAYELDVGRPPFFHISPEQTRRLITNGQYDRSLIRDNQLRHLIDRMLQLNRKMRISARELLNLDFFRELNEENAMFELQYCM